MIAQLRSEFSKLPQIFPFIEAVLVGAFLLQGIRFLVATLYSDLASASLYPALDPRLIDPNIPGLVEQETFSSQLVLVVILLLLPLMSLLTGRFAVMVGVAAILTAIGRVLMIGSEDLIPAALTVGGALFYLAMIIRQRVQILPIMFVLAFMIDQYVRTLGDTVDVSRTVEYEGVVLAAGMILIVLAIILMIRELPFRRRQSDDEGATKPTHTQGLMTIWGGIGLGALLFLELSLLSMPNAIVGRASLDYADYLWIAPALMAATALPLVPAVRRAARGFIGMFDSSVRGWSWMLLIMLLLVLGIRLGGLVGGISLIISQFLVTMLWWWLARAKTAKERTFTGFWIVLGVVLFMLLVVMDIFTYEYAYVRDFRDDLEFLNATIPPLLRGFRGLGVAVILLSVFFAVLPMVQTHRRIAWMGGQLRQSVLAVLFLLLLGTGATYVAVQPPTVTPVVDTDDIRIGTYNLHSGYNEFFQYALDEIPATIASGGADVVLLQEVEVGRMTSYGVDQALWLARKLKMDVRFFPTNEGLQGLAVLSKVPIVFDDGALIDSVASQTGLQRVQILPSEGVITIYNTWLDPLLDVGGTRHDRKCRV